MFILQYFIDSHFLFLDSPESSYCGDFYLPEPSSDNLYSPGSSTGGLDSSSSSAGDLDSSASSSGDSVPICKFRKKLGCEIKIFMHIN